jgi:hypothetical protein
MDIKTQDLSGIIDHLGSIMGSSQRLQNHLEAMEKAHEKLHTCAKALHQAHKVARASGQITSALHKAHEAYMDAHESARLARLGYKGEHTRHLTKVAEACSAINKVVGGGPARATAPSEPTSLPSRLRISGANKGVRQNPNAASPFDSLRKSSISAPRVFKNASNPMWVRD